MAEAVRRGILERCGTEPTVSTDAAAGAAALALRSLTSVTVSAGVHRRLTHG